MAKRQELRMDACPVARALTVVGDQWSLMIVRDAFDGVRRFGVFQKNLGVARNILADRLRKLVENGILDMAPASDGTAYGEYVLTPKGLSLFGVLVTLRQWSEAHLYGAGESHSTMVERDTGTAVPTMRLSRPDGRVLGPADTVVNKLPVLP
ncbi:winged helix-turn-helix transcriptional regulator [Janthinobacterium sp. CG_23.3]|uniref:winged helix-turn-helix transcriptional regulator n=1 Tax=Janthinobacterium sp. CG_23.3 TaxID=3349634 RepID=UPI0038D39AB0